MKTYNNIYSQLCSYENLFSAYQKARKHKTSKRYVIEFENDLTNNLLQLRADLLFHSYRPELLKAFIIREPKTRKISKSAFRDRVVHHALCNIIEPIFEKSFIYDSYANRKGKGVLKAIQKKNIRKFRNKLEVLCEFYDKAEISYDDVYNSLEGWCAYTKTANAFNLKKRAFTVITKKFTNEMSDKEINRCLNLLKCP